MRWTLFVLVAALCLPSTVMARDIGPLVPGPGPYELVAGPCPEDPTYEGCTHLDGTIYLLPGSMQYLTHEEGHLYDWRYLDEGERSTFRSLVRAPRQWSWWITDDEQKAVSEWFADAYATCALGRLEGWPGFWMNPYISRGRRVCRLIANAWS